MREGLHTSAGTIQWVVSGYALAFGLTLVAGGRLGDAYGRRRLMLIGLAGFVVSSAAVGLAPNAALVVLARLAAGRQRRAAHPAELRAHPAALPRPRARPRLRDLRADRLDLVRDRAGPRRPDHRAWPARRTAGAGSSWSTSRSGWPRWSPCRDGAAAARPTTGRADNRIDVPGALLLGADRALPALPGGPGRGRRPAAAAAARRRPALRLGVRRAGSGVRRGAATRRCSTSRCCAALPGYVNGLAVGALYFTGFTGRAPGDVALPAGGPRRCRRSQAGLLMMPFARRLGGQRTARRARRLRPRPPAHRRRARSS